jgi:hypothetical protein
LISTCPKEPKVPVGSLFSVQHDEVRKNFGFGFKSECKIVIVFHNFPFFDLSFYNQGDYFYSPLTFSGGVKIKSPIKSKSSLAVQLGGLQLEETLVLRTRESV